MKLTYRNQDEIDQWRERDPLLAAGAKLETSVRERIDDAESNNSSTKPSSSRATARTRPHPRRSTSCTRVV